MHISTNVCLYQHITNHLSCPETLHLLLLLLVALRTNFPLLYTQTFLKVTMASVTPFSVAVPNDRLEKLRARLELTEFPDELDDAGWDYGAPLADVKRLTAYWKDRFDWKKQEADINKLPQYQTKVEVDGYEALNIHFIHQKSKNSKAIPLLFVHGCILFATTRLRCAFLTCLRAWQFPRSGETPTAPRRTKRREGTCVSRHCAIFAQLWLLRWCQKAWIRAEAVC